MKIILTILKLIFRLLRQRPIKTIRTIKSPTRLFSTFWVEYKKISFENFCDKIGKNIELLDQSKLFYKNFLLTKHIIIKDLPITGGLPGSSGGGGGNELLLYYLTIMFKPNVVLESGVSAGASSAAILHALADNKNGHLISSDLPLHLKEEDIGKLVPENLKSRWTLYKNGDEINLPIIIKEIHEINLVYYDSLKTYQGKENFFKIIMENFSPKIIIIDDIDRDFWFRDFTKKLKKNFYVVGSCGIILFK